MNTTSDSHQYKHGVFCANATRHYTLIAVGVVIVFFGANFRFMSDSYVHADLISDIAFSVGVMICLRAVLNILS